MGNSDDLGVDQILVEDVVHLEDEVILPDVQELVSYWATKLLCLGVCLRPASASNQPAVGMQPPVVVRSLDF